MEGSQVVSVVSVVQSTVTRRLSDQEVVTLYNQLLSQPLISLTFYDVVLLILKAADMRSNFILF